MWYSPTTVSFSSPETVCPLCCVSVCLLYSAPGVKCLIRNPDDSLLHLQIEFLYRSASGLHFPTGFNQYSLTQLKFGETNKNALIGTDWVSQSTVFIKALFDGDPSNWPTASEWSQGQSSTQAPKLSLSCFVWFREAGGQRGFCKNSMVLGKDE